MALRNFDPYAPPRDVPFVAPPTALPEGFRLFRLDEAAYGPFMRSVLLRRYLTFVVSAWLFVAIFNFRQPTSTLLVAFVTVPLAFGALLALGARGMRRRDVDAYQLVLGPRVARRVGASLGPAEVLQPEVTRIVETRDGLWLLCDARRRALFVARALERYGEARSALETWRPIETARGFAAWRVSQRVIKQQGPRDEVAGTVLAEDASLWEELETARAGAISSVPSRPTRSLPRRIFFRGAFLLLVLFAVWRLFPPPSPTNRPPTRPGSYEHR